MDLPLARPFGHWSGCHAFPWSVTQPNWRPQLRLKFTQPYQYGIMVTADGNRFVDEGRTFRISPMPSTASGSLQQRDNCMADLRRPTRHSLAMRIAALRHQSHSENH